MFIDDQHPSSGSFSIFLIAKYNIDSVIFISYHDVPSCHYICYSCITVGVGYLCYYMSLQESKVKQRTSVNNKDVLQTTVI